MSRSTGGYKARRKEKDGKRKKVSLRDPLGRGDPLDVSCGLYFY